MTDGLDNNMAQRMIDATEANTDALVALSEQNKEILDQLDRIHDKSEELVQAIDDMTAAISRLDRNRG